MHISREVAAWRKRGYKMQQKRLQGSLVWFGRGCQVELKQGWIELSANLTSLADLNFRPYIYPPFVTY